MFGKSTHLPQDLATCSCTASVVSAHHRMRHARTVQRGEASKSPEVAMCLLQTFVRRNTPRSAEGAFSNEAEERLEDCDVSVRPMS